MLCSWFFGNHFFVVFGCRDQSCGTLFCSGGWKFPVTSRKSFYTVGNDICNEATMNPEDNYPADLGMVPTGTECGKNMVRKLTVDHHGLKICTLYQCPHNVFICLSGLLQSTVSGHQKHKRVRNKWLLCQMQQPWGKKIVYFYNYPKTLERLIAKTTLLTVSYLWQVCNHKSECHCEPGWAPPFCDVQQSELPEGTVHF